MVLEATMIVLDTSEFMRNGDYAPTRFQAELEAATTVFNHKTRENPENTVGLMTMSGEVKCTFISNLGQFLAGSRETHINGQSRLGASIQVAQLALRHRQNKNQRQRIIVFVGSPITDSEKDLGKLAARMKKNNIAVDFVDFGQEGGNAAKLQNFVDTVNSGDNSNLLTVPPGAHLLSEQVARSPILGGSGAGSGAGGDFMDDGMDFEDDPELAMALRMSLEEARQRQEREAQEAIQESAKGSESEQPNNNGAESGAESSAGPSAGQETNGDKKE